MIIGTGTFSLGENHVMEGIFKLTRQGDASALFETSEDFFFDGSLRARLGLIQGCAASTRR